MDRHLIKTSAEDPTARYWTIVEGLDGALIVTSWASDPSEGSEDERYDQVVLERFGFEIVLRKPEIASTLPLTIIAEILDLQARLHRSGLDWDRVPPMLVERAKVQEIYRALGLGEAPAHGVAKIFTVRICWHTDLDVTAERRL